MKLTGASPVKLTGASSAFAGPGPAFDCLLPFGVLGLRGVLRGVFPLLLERADGAGAIAGLGARSLTGGRPAGRGPSISFFQARRFLLKQAKYQNIKFGEKAKPNMHTDRSAFWLFHTHSLPPVLSISLSALSLALALAR